MDYKGKLRELLKNPLNVFLLKGFLVMGFWTMLTEYIAIHPIFKPIWTGLNNFLLTIIVNSAAFLLKMVGYSVTLTGAIIRIDDSPGVHVGPACIGTGMLYGFFALIFVYPGDSRKKIWFTPLGLLGIMFLNILRVSVLAVNSLYNPANVDFNHKYIFNVLVYIFIFIMWILWVGYIGKTPSNQVEKEN